MCGVGPRIQDWDALRYDAPRLKRFDGWNGDRQPSACAENKTLTPQLGRRVQIMKSRADFVRCVRQRWATGLRGWDCRE